MLGRHRFLVCLFLALFLITGNVIFSANLAASGPVPLEETLNDEDAFILTFPVIWGGYGDASVPTVDLSIARIEVIQAVQNEANSVPLVKGRQTIVRVYINSSASSILDGVRVSLSGFTNGQPLIDSPLTQLGTVYKTADRGVYTSSFNFYLPTSWVEKNGISLTALVDAADVIHETDESNNSTTGNFTFNTVPALDLVIVPIAYTHTPSGETYSPPNDTVSGIVFRLYPVPTMTVSLHQALSFSGDLTLATAWSNLLEVVTALKVLDQAPASRVYYGLIPSGWFNGGYAGLGWVGQRTSVGLQLTEAIWPSDTGGFTAAHEIGHNLGSRHAPGCGVTSPDPNWPWLNDGHTHEYGLDIGTLLVKAPTSEDVMGYCRDGGIWISEYTYRKFMVDQQQQGIARIADQSQETLFVRATLDEDDHAIMRPLYHLVATPSAIVTTSDYAVQLLDSSGDELARYPVEVMAAEGDNFTSRMISALVPIPVGELAQVRLLKGTTILAERQLQSGYSLLSVAHLTKTDSGLRLNWTSGGQPALVRYTNDDGATWSTLGFDLDANEITVDPGQVSGSGYFEVSFADTALPVRLINTNN